MIRKILAVLAFAFLLAVTAFAENPAPQDQLTLPAGDWLGHLATQRMVVRALYDRLTAYTAGSTKQLQFRVDDVRVLQPAELDEVLWLDIVSMPGGEMIDMLRNVHQNDYTGTTTVIYQPSWSVVDEGWKSIEASNKLTGLTVSDALREASRTQPELAQVEAVTAYRITARMDGRSRSYRAVLLWLPSGLGTERSLIVNDNITQGVEEAAREILAVGTPRDAQIEEPEDLGGFSEKATCRAWTNTTKQSYLNQDSAGHITGRHYSQPTFQVTCSCSSTCASKCVASIPSTTCRDEGVRWDVLACHKMAQAAKANTNQNDNGNLRGASCAAGYGCVKKTCGLCACGLSVGVSISGVNVSFSSTGGPDWDGDLSYSRTCAICTR